MNTLSQQPVLVLCMKWGTAYGPEYVNRLRNGVARNLSYPHRFICFTDNASGIDQGVEIFPLPSLDLPPQNQDLRWRKLTLLGKDVFGLTGTALFLDLDLVIVDRLEVFFDLPEQFLIIRDMDLFRAKPLRKLTPEKDKFLNSIGNSSVFRMVMGAHYDILEEFVRDPSAALSSFKDEQQFLSYELNKRGLLHYWPKEWCVSFKNHCIPRYWKSYLQDPFIPNDAKIIVFAGNLKMQEVVEGGGSKWYRRIGNINWLINQWK